MRIGILIWQISKIGTNKARENDKTPDKGVLIWILNLLLINFYLS